MSSTKLAKISETQKAIVAQLQQNMMVDAGDLEIPRLNVVQKTSNIDAPFGSLVIDKQFVLADPGQKISCIPINTMKGWVEDLPFGEGEPQRAYNEADKDTLQKNSNFKILEFAEVVLGFPQPEESETADEAYPHIVGGKNYAIGKIYVQKGAYRFVFKKLATFLQCNPTLPLFWVNWSITTMEKTSGMNTWFEPMLSNSTSETTEAERDWATKFVI